MKWAAVIVCIALIAAGGAAWYWHAQNVVLPRSEQGISLSLATECSEYVWPSVKFAERSGGFLVVD